MLLKIPKLGHFLKNLFIKPSTLPNWANATPSVIKRAIKKQTTFACILKPSSQQNESLGEDKRDASCEAGLLLTCCKWPNDGSIKGELMAEEGGRLFAALCQVVPLINSHVIVPQALRAWGNDGHAFVC